MRRWIFDLLIGFIFVIIIFFSMYAFHWLKFLTTPMLAKDQTPIAVVITPGTPLIALAWNLKRQGLLSDPNRFVWMARLRGDLSRVKAGEYILEPGMNPWQFLTRIVAGKVILHQVTIIEGWTFAEMMQAINNNPYLTHTLNGLDSQTIMTRLGLPNVQPEGQFYPDTYLFNRGTSDTTILKIAYNKMQNVLTTAWQKRDPHVPLQNPYQALIIGSLIEKETSVAQERTKIAGVIFRRLQKNMRLQIDPTVIYALGDQYQGKLTPQDLTFANPYNTYVNSGLPPTPIAIPSAASINAALHPAAGTALYYVATGYGGHVFSNTLQQQDAAIAKYLLRPRFDLAPGQLWRYFMNQTGIYQYCPAPLFKTSKASAGYFSDYIAQCEVFSRHTI